MQATTNDDATTLPTTIGFSPLSPQTLILMREESSGMQELLCDDSEAKLGDASSSRSRLSMTSAAILELLDAHEGNDLVKISRNYRKIVNEVLMNWQSQMEEDGGDDNDEVEMESLEVLTIMKSFANLAECFFLNTKSDGSSDQVLIADLVRYLRSSMLESIEDSEFGGFETMQRVLEADEPEQWDPSDDGKQLTPYWRAVRRLCIRGHTADAWKLLSYHSLCSSQEFQDKFVHEFDIIRQILEEAPLPGGICTDHDSDFDTGDKKLSEESYIHNIIGVKASQQNEDVWRLWDKFISIPAAESRWNGWKQSVEDILQESRSYNHTEAESSMAALFRAVPQLNSCVFQVLNGQAPIHSFDHWAEGLLTELLYKVPSMPSQNIAARSEFYLKLYHKMQDSPTMKFLFDTVIDTMKFDAGAAIVALQKFATQRVNTNTLSPLCHVLSALLCDLMHLSGSIVPKPDDFNIHREMLVSAAEVCMSVLNVTDNFIAAKIVSRILLLPSAGLPSSNELVPSERCVASLLEYISHYAPESDHAVFELLSLVESILSRIMLFDASMFSWRPLSRIIFNLFEIECILCSSRAILYELEDRPGGLTFWLLHGAFKECQAHNFFEKYAITSISAQFQCNCLDKLASYCNVLSGNLSRAVVTTILTNGEEKNKYLLDIEQFENQSEDLDRGARQTKAKVKLISLQEVTDEVIAAIDEFESSLESQNGILEGDFSLLGPYTSASFALLKNIAKLTHAFINDDYHSAANILHDCLVNRIYSNSNRASRDEDENMVHNVTLPLAPINMWMDLLFLSSDILEKSVKSATKLNETFNVKGMQSLLERFTWFIEISSLPCSESVDSSFKRMVQDSVPNRNDVDWPKACQNWINSMRLLMSKGLMNAFVQQNSMMRKVTDNKPVNHITIEDEVKSMLMCPVFDA